MNQTIFGNRRRVRRLPLVIFVFSLLLALLILGLVLLVFHMVSLLSSVILFSNGKGNIQSGEIGLEKFFAMPAAGVSSTDGRMERI